MSKWRMTRVLGMCLSEFVAKRLFAGNCGDRQIG
jgi:hypothetical protein